MFGCFKNTFYLCTVISQMIGTGRKPCTARGRLLATSYKRPEATLNVASFLFT